MSQITLAAERRTTKGSGPAGRLRATGKIPAVLYGKGLDATSITVDHHEVRQAFNDRANREAPFTITLDGTSYAVKIQAIQRSPRDNTAVHIDFITV